MNEPFWEIVKTLLTAAAGFGGVWYGQKYSAHKDAKQAEQDAKQAERERALVASVVIDHLERYINGCVSVAYDDGTEYGRPAGEHGYSQTTTTPPEFDPHKLDLNWSILPPDLIYDIFAIRSRQEHIQSYLDSEGFDDPPDFSEFFWTRSLLFAKLGQQVTQIAIRLRKAGGIPHEILEKGDWSREERLAQVIERCEAHKAERERLHLESMARPFPANDS